MKRTVGGTENGSPAPAVPGGEHGVSLKNRKTLKTVISVVLVAAAVAVAAVIFIPKLTNMRSTGSGDWIEGYHTDSKRSSNSIDFEMFDKAYEKITGIIETISDDGRYTPYLVYSGYSADTDYRDGRISFTYNLDDDRTNAVADIKLSFEESDLSLRSLTVFTYVEDKQLISDLFFGILSGNDIELPYTFDELFEHGYVTVSRDDGTTMLVNVEYNYASIELDINRD